MLQERVAHFYDYLMQGNSAALSNLYPFEPIIETPLDEQIKGSAALEKYVLRKQALLIEWQAKPEIATLTFADELLVIELFLHIQPQGNEIRLPVVLIADLIPGGVLAIRIYHSMCEFGCE